MCCVQYDVLSVKNAVPIIQCDPAARPPGSNQPDPLRTPQYLHLGADTLQGLDCNLHVDPPSWVLLPCHKETVLYANLCEHVNSLGLSNPKLFYLTSVCNGQQVNPLDMDVVRNIDVCPIQNFL